MANDFSGDSSCKALWRFESGALTADSQGGNTLTSNGSPVSDTSDYKEGAGCVDLESGDSSDYFSILDANLDAGFPLKSGDTNKKFTVVGWFKPESNPSGTKYLWAKYSSSTNGRSFAVIHSDVGDIAFNLGYNSGNSFETVYGAGSAMTNGKWHYFSVSFEDSTKAYRIYVWNATDGTLVVNKTGTTANNIYVGSMDITIGRRGDSATGWIEGKVDGLAVFNRVLSYWEILAIREGCFGGIGAEDNSSGQSSSGVTSYTLSHNVGTGSGTNRILLVGANVDNTANPTLSATFNGVSMTLLRTEYVNGLKCALFYMLDDDLPTSAGDYNIVVSSTSSDDIKVIAQSFVGVAQEEPESVNGGTVNGNTLTVSVTTQTAGAIVWAYACSASSTNTWSSYSLDNFSGSLTGGPDSTAHASWEHRPTVGSVSSTYNYSQSWYTAMIVVSVAPASEDTNQTVGAGLLQGSGSLPATFLSLGATAGVNPFSGYAALQGSSQQAGAAVSLGALAPGAAIFGTDLKAGSLLSLNELFGQAEILAAAQSCGATIGINLLTSSATVYASTPISGVSIALGLLAGTTAIRSVTVVTLGDVTVTLSVLPGDSSISSAATSVGATVPAGIFSGEAEILSGSVAIHATFQVDLLQGLASIQSPALSAGMALALGILQGIPGIRSVSVQISSTTEITVGILSAEGEVWPPALSAGSMVGLGAFSGVGAVYAASANIDALLEIASLSGTAVVLTVDASLGVISVLAVVDGLATIREVAITASVQGVVNLLEAVGSIFGPDVVIDWDQILNLLQGQGGLYEARASVVVIPASQIYFATTRRRDYGATEREREYMAASRHREYEAEKRERDFLAMVRKRDYYDA